MSDRLQQAEKRLYDVLDKAEPIGEYPSRRSGARSGQGYLDDISEVFAELGAVEDGFARIFERTHR